MRNTRSRPAAGSPLRILHVITRLIVGGAQENTILSCALIDRERFPSEILSGIETGPEGELHGEARSREIPHHLEPSLVRAIHPIKDALALSRLTAFMRRGQFDVVHTHSSKAGILGRIAARTAGVPVVVHTVHGWPFAPGQSRAVFDSYVRLERFCARFTDALVAVATPDREEGLALGIGRPAQYRLIRSGIELEKYRNATIEPDAARARLGLPPGAFVIGSVGRLSPQKAPLDLLAAFEIVARARPEAHLVIVGDGPERAAAEAFVARAGLTARVHLPGLRRDIPELMRAFHVFALASRWEGLPRVFPEAMASGLPVVATRVDGAADLIVGGENGWLVETGDVEAMSRHLLMLAAEPDRLRRMGKRAREGLEDFSAVRMTEQLGKLYRELSGRGR